ncbi:fumarylacetoacetate hydrolase family protein [Natrialba chahannaoensis]|uniref:fumarylacetoacetate hydrolase family protein n=1 Tax=Natrialba chahannaoensis TaxID=68911 RepID=UPI003083EF28
MDVLEAPMTTRVNGEVWVEGTVDEMCHSFTAIIEHVSQPETLSPGDVHRQRHRRRGLWAQTPPVARGWRDGGTRDCGYRSTRVLVVDSG